LRTPAVTKGRSCAVLGMVLSIDVKNVDPKNKNVKNALFMNI